MSIHLTSPQDHCIDHVCVLVSDIEGCLDKLQGKAPFFSDVDSDRIEKFPSEGTRELYCGGDHLASRLLLVEAISDGPYQRTLKKRGPGLHHIGIVTGNQSEFVEHLDGWFLHRTSIRTLRESKTAWMARPGISCLLEIVEGRIERSDRLIQKLWIPVESHLRPLIKFSEGFLVASNASDFSLSIQGVRLDASDFYV